MRCRLGCTFASAVAMVILAWVAPLAVAQAKSRFDLPVQPLADSLRAVGSQASLNILFDPPLVASRQAPALKGEFTTREAFILLLEGTGLHHEFLNERTVVLAPAPTAQPVASGISSSAKKSERDSSDVGPARFHASVPDLESKSFWSRFRLAQAETPPNAARSSQRETGGASQSSDNETESLTTVIVTAQKREERLQDVPISISVLSGEDLDKSSLVGVTEALNRVPGVLATTPGMGGGTQVAVRGVGASGPLFNGSSPVGYYFDSVPFAQIRQAVVPDSNAYDLERVEVLRGPQGTLYGVNAENGLVRVLTHEADLDQLEFKVRTTLSSTDEGGENYRADAALNVPLVGGKLAARAVVGYQNLDGWVDQPNEEDINDRQVRNYRLRVNARPSEQLSIGLTSWRSNDDRGAPSFAKADRQVASILDQPIATDLEAHGLKIGYEFHRFSVSSMTSYVDYANRSVLDYTPLAIALGFDFLTGQTLTSEFWSRTFSQEVLFSSTPSGAWRWTAGAFYRDTDDRYRQAAPALLFLVDLPDSARSYAGFGELSRRFGSNRFEWTLGLRYFHDEVSSGQNVDPSTTGGVLYDEENTSHSTTPRAVVTWYPSDDFTVYGSYSEGFRSSVPVGYFNALAAPNLPPIDPDKLRNYEVGAKANLHEGRFAIESSVHFIDWRDVQQQVCVPFGLDCTPALANSDSASGPGIDLGVTVRPVGGLDLGVNVSWNDLTFDDSTFDTAGALLFGKGERLAYSSEWTIGASADYAFRLGTGGFNAMLSASVNYSSQQISRFVGGPGSTTILQGDDLLVSRAGFAILSPDERWTATVFADNINDEDGIAEPLWTGAGSVPDWYPRLRPRTIGVQLDYRW